MKELEEYAKINNIPIMQKDGILYLINYIKENNIKNIPEIGSAIGYSSIMMASINSDIRITTIERDKDRYDLAVSNIKKYKRFIIEGTLLQYTDEMGIKYGLNSEEHYNKFPKNHANGVKIKNKIKGNN